MWEYGTGTGTVPVALSHLAVNIFHRQDLTYFNTPIMWTRKSKYQLVSIISAILLIIISMLGLKHIYYKPSIMGS